MTARDDTPCLILFDVDGTLVDSQLHIIGAMRAAFAAAGLPAPQDEAIRSIIGLSLSEAMLVLAPEADSEALVENYRNSFARTRMSDPASALTPLYPGALAALDHCRGVDHYVLGIATGKSRRGLTHLMESHALADYFVTTQVADDHPSKPHPSMVLRAAAETGIDMGRVLMIGDTSYDMAMGRSAGARTLGVAWGYHGVDALHAAGAEAVIDRYEDLPDAIASIWAST
ncbi:HAD-IA family hydrolase [Brevirhabdus sp.]|uniref:HAD-IA family hydrolase n=1 Tax=Brevirhabdus sp. TaxID=2004514 RepID=UPI004059E61E